MSLSIPSWTIPFDLDVPVGTLDFNTDILLSSGATGQFFLNGENCEALIPVRVQDDDVPQGDGQQTHERFFSAFELTLAVQLWTSDVPACDEDLTEMADMLMRYVRNIPSNPSSDLVEARVHWTPAGANERMLRRVCLNDALTWSMEGPVVQAQFQVKSMYPYAWDSQEIVTPLDATLTNTGTADFWPVIKVFGPTSAFIITTDVTDEFGNVLLIEWDTGNPGASGLTVDPGDYIEIDTFRNTMYLNGDGANMKPGLTVGTSDFFPIAVGANNIDITGAAASILWQNAWG